MCKFPFFTSDRRKQKGAVLVTGLIFLVIITMMVLAMLMSGSLEERMASNERNRQLALQAAEAVVRDAELNLLTGAPFVPFYDASSFTSGCANGLCSRPSTNAQPRWQTINWNSASVTRTFAAAASQLNGLPGQPRYIVEIVTPPRSSNSASSCDPGVANITARGVGNDNAVVFIQSGFRFRPDSC